LSDIAVAGADAESMKNGCSFRVAFLETPKLSSRRSASARQPAPYHDPAALLSWKRAIRLAEICQSYDPIDLLNDDWYDEWIALSLGDALYWSYLDYIEWRLVSAALGYFEIQLPRFRSEWTDSELTSSLLPPFSFSHSGRLYRGQTEVVGVAYPEPKSPFEFVRSPSGKSASGSRLLG
jgi:hypothetical protein